MDICLTVAIKQSLLTEMRGNEHEWSKRYKKFVESGLAENDDEFIAILKASPRCIGGSDFLAWVDELCEKIMDKHRLADFLNAGSGSAISRQLSRYRKLFVETKKREDLLIRCGTRLNEKRTKL